MSKITMPTIEGGEVDAMSCVACGADATPAIVPLCVEHHHAWFRSPDYRLASEIENKLREAFAAKLRGGHVPEIAPAPAEVPL